MSDENMGASAAPTGLAGAEAPEPPSRLGPSDGIPSATDIVWLEEGEFGEAALDLVTLPNRIASEVRHHLREMYPGFVKAAPGTMLLSVGNHARNIANAAVARFLGSPEFAAMAASVMSAGTAETAKQAQAEGRQRDGCEDSRDAQGTPQ